ncbi:MAG: GNAT family N-acetyltransferase [Bacteroidetes bacterium]|jgi:L-amino acid N-acyltransferase YncA|nr:GNAT family N-acetyltransferase [Bacteroidota bacterium]MBT5531309.1 GNAT family N-acetyltransferase [Cytophagia bacterium]
MNDVKLIDTNASNAHTFSMCGYKNIKQTGYQKKIEWNIAQFEKGMKYKVLFSEQDGAIGAIEYIPGEFSWRPVNAHGYYFIHCIYIMKKPYKDKSYGVKLLNSCIEDAKAQKKAGVAVLVRKGSWMASKSLFIKMGFKEVEKVEPDFDLLVLTLNDSFPIPSMKDNGFGSSTNDKGLVIYYTDQCPYIAKSVKEITEVARDLFGISANLILIDSHEKAQRSPCAFGTFCITFSGKVVADHPVSSTRFKNIMNKILN